MTPPSTAVSIRSIRTRVWTTVAAAAVMVAAALSVGCGVSPAYEPEPRMPGAYVAAPGNPEPATSEELAAANAQRSGDIAVGDDGDEYSDTDPSALTEFKPALEGHGAWVDDSTYGTVWVPAESEVGTDFVPYTTAGHWTYDDSTSYVWVSDYSWGWAPFHYGRWVHVSRHGWAWIPGRTYAGAWVVWRTGGPDYGYVGWAPAGPDWYWYNGYAVGWTFGYTPYYSYCHHDYLYDHHVGGRVVRGSDPRSREYEAHTRPYTPANPTVGRVAASPTVGGGRVTASPRVGPRPSELGMKADSIVAPPAAHAGLGLAQLLASPSTAVAAGAQPPVQTRRRPVEAVVTEPAPRAFDGRGPVTSRVDAVARAPQVQGVNPVPPRAMVDSRPSSSSARGFAESPAAVPPSYRSSPSLGASSPPPSSFRSSAPSQPTFRSSPSVAAPSQPTFRSSPSYSAPSQPTFRSSPSYSAPSQPTFRSSPSVSSPSQPSFRSSPSVSSPSRSAAPSVARPSSPSRSTSAPAVRRGR